MIIAGFILAVIVILIIVPNAFHCTVLAAFLGDILGVILLTALFVVGVSVVVALIKSLAFLWPLIVLGFTITILGGGK